LKNSWLSNNENKANWIAHIGKVNGKGKAIPLQAWAGLEGSISLRLPDFKTIGT
jgi:hypothetical protein